jgi:hypothetical protein
MPSKHGSCYRKVIAKIKVFAACHEVTCIAQCTHELGTGFFMHKRIISAAKKVEFASDRMSYIILRGRWCHIIVLNVHAPTEDKTDYVKDSFYEDLKGVFDKFHKYHMKFLLEDFNAKVARKIFLK